MSFDVESWEKVRWNIRLKCGNCGKFLDGYEATSWQDEKGAIFIYWHECHPLSDERERTLQQHHEVAE